nr:PREDICTED: mannan-binding lectin serine protease 2 [Latimeria chalumnae]|eukprot:XP_014342712.1 PREDICTED: mannan-binding lectin serine protease 2 [Latimeria chalumnae]
MERATDNLFLHNLDINECERLIDGEPTCDQHCHNYLGGYYCSCKTGYHLHEDKRSCIVKCSGRVLTAKSGEITSPDYPMPYPKHSNCNYHIKMEEGFSIILEFLEPFDVETHPDALCPYDVLKIKAGKKSYGPFCGNSLPQKMETGSHIVDITFITDTSGTNSGWKIKYTTTAMPCPNPVAPSHGHISPLQPRYILKDQFVVTCDTGYELLEGKREIKSFKAVCQKDGTWDKTLPQCHIVDCTVPDPISNGKILYITGPDETTYQSVIQYKCNEPFYVMQGNITGVYKCAANGYWEDSKGSKTLPACEPVCGKPIRGTLLRIFGGKKASSGEFPWQVLIILKQGFGGGVLLQDNWVLTAAHVIHDYKDISLIKMGVIKRSSTRYIEAFPEKVFIHEDYMHDNVNYNNDIALIKLNQKVPVNKVLMPICLPGKDDRFNIKNHELGHVSGWGTTERRFSSNDLLYTEIPVINLDKCKETYRSKKAPSGEPLVITENMLCAGMDEGGKDSCSGDSGGPLVFYDDVTKAWFVGGIVSWGLECGVAGQYGVYTKVFNFISWIEHTILQNS